MTRLTGNAATQVFVTVMTDILGVETKSHNCQLRQATISQTYHGYRWKTLHRNQHTPCSVPF